MMSDLNIKFLQSKIQELKTALFFKESESFSTITTHVISAELVDDEGQIWFVVPNQSALLHDAENPFAAKMDFFKKGVDFYIKLNGIASIVDNADEMPESLAAELRKKVSQKQALLVCVKIQRADYFESMPKPTQNWLQQGGMQIFNWLLNPQYDHKSPQLLAIPISLEQ